MLEGRPMRFRPLPLALAAALAAAVACKTTAGGDRPTPSLKSGQIEIDQAALVSALVQKHGEASRARAERGVRQVAAFWRKEDGDAATLRAFTDVAFVADPQQLDALLRRFSAALEQIDGHMVEIGRALRSWSELELEPQMDVDQLFAALDVAAHVPEDLFSTKLAFVALLNFPQPDLQEMVAQGPRWSRKQWTQARLTRRFVVRPSGAALQAVARARADGEAYIAGYNIWMHHVLAPDGRRLFPKGVRLLTHWNLRDQIKADYAEPDKAMALARQRLIQVVMERIVTQTIPRGVIDDPRADWNPASNAVTASPPEEVETEQMKAQGRRPVQPSISADGADRDRSALPARRRDPRAARARAADADPGIAAGAEGGGPDPEAARAAAGAVRHLVPRVRGETAGGRAVQAHARPVPERGCLQEGHPAVAPGSRLLAGEGALARCAHRGGSRTRLRTRAGGGAPQRDVS